MSAHEYGSAQADSRLDDFRRGLYPILLEGDVSAFRRYLARWEDMIGDTAELAETPVEQQRRTMATLLRRPQQFNLPPWPADRGWSPAPPAREAPAEPEGQGDGPADADERGELGHSRTVAAPNVPAPTLPGPSVDRRLPAALAPATPASTTPAATEREPRPGIALTQANDKPQEGDGMWALQARATEEPSAPSRVYQVDMLTGEYVEVVPQRTPAHLTRDTGGAEDEPSAAAPAPRRRPRRSHRAASAGVELRQLAFWS